MTNGPAHEPGNGPRPVRTDERQGQPQPVTCDRCAAAVVAVKFSAVHTSVQWGPGAVATCQEFQERAAAGECTALIDSCLSLRASIDRAVAAGRLAVTPP